MNKNIHKRCYSYNHRQQTVQTQITRTYDTYLFLQHA